MANAGWIVDVFPENEWASLRILAGLANFPRAVTYNWTKVKALLEAGSRFIAGNLDALPNDGKGMDPAFPDAFNVSQTAFEIGMVNFYNAKKMCHWRRLRK